MGGGGVSFRQPGVQRYKGRLETDTYCQGCRGQA